MEIDWGKVLSYVGTFVGGVFSAWIYHWMPKKVAYDAEQRKRRDGEIREAVERIHPALALYAAAVKLATRTNLDPYWVRCFLLQDEFMKIYFECALYIGPGARRAFRPFVRLVSSVRSEELIKRIEFMNQNSTRLKATTDRAVRAIVAIRERH